MKELKNAKKFYEQTEIPEELGKRVQEAIATVPEEKGRVVVMRKRTKRTVRNIASAAAIAVILFTAALNTSQSFAAGLEDVAVLGPIAKVLTFRSYENADEDKTVNVRIPKVETEDENLFAADVNAAIEEKVQAYTEQADKDIAEYKEAFIATGGTEEEFAQKEIKVDVSYEVKSECDDVVSFVITANESWSNAYGVQYFYNLDLRKNKELTLKELLGEDYIEKANTSILAQMDERMRENADMYYFTPEEGGFETVTDAAKFYINAAGNPVIVFDKYEVAPGFMGRPEFEIKK